MVNELSVGLPGRETLSTLAGGNAPHHVRIIHDGTALTSADIKASFERVKNPPQGVVSSRQRSLTKIAGITANRERIA